MESENIFWILLVMIFYHIPTLALSSKSTCRTITFGHSTKRYSVLAGDNVCLVCNLVTTTVTLQIKENPLVSSGILAEGLSDEYEFEKNETTWRLIIKILEEDMRINIRVVFLSRPWRLKFYTILRMIILYVGILLVTILLHSSMIHLKNHLTLAVSRKKETLRST